MPFLRAALLKKKLEPKIEQEEILQPQVIEELQPELEGEIEPAQLDELHRIIESRELDAEREIIIEVVGPEVPEIFPEFEIVTEEISEPEIEVVAQEIAEPEAEVITEEVTEPEVEVVTEEIAEPEVEIVTEEIAAPETELVTEEITEPEAEVITEEITEPEAEIITEEVTEPETEITTEEITEPETEVITEEVTPEEIPQEEAVEPSESETSTEEITATLPPEIEEAIAGTKPEEAPTGSRKKDYSGEHLDYDFTSDERYVDKVSTKTEFDKMLDELSAISKELLSWQTEKFARDYTEKFTEGGESSVADMRKCEAFLGGYITNAAMMLCDMGYMDSAIRQLEQAINILKARKKLEDETSAIKSRVEEQNDAVDLSDILGLFGDG